MQMTAETVERALSAVKRFRIGGTLIAMIPLICSFLLMVSGRGRDERSILGLVSMCLLLLVLWACHCAERFLKSGQSTR